MFYGKEPANETRRKTQLQLQMLAAGAPAAPHAYAPAHLSGRRQAVDPAIRVGSAKSERPRPMEAIVGRPTSAAALLPARCC